MSAKRHYSHGRVEHSSRRNPAVSWQYSHDHPVPLPEHGSHSQGSHDREYAPHSTENPMKPADRRGPHGGE